MSALSSLLPFEVVQALGWTLVHFLWQGVVLAFLSIALLPLCRTASDRYTAAFVTLAFMVAAPVITFATIHRSGAHGLGLDTGIWRHVVDAPAAFVWMNAVVAVWIAGVAALSIRAVGGWYVAQSLRHATTSELKHELAQRCEALARRAGITQSIAFLQSASAAVPMVVGWFRPAILLPVAVIARLPLYQIEALVLHELAHIRRRDAVANLFQIAAETLLFYHPAVWWVSARMRTERENCCDDLAVAQCGDAIGYARALTAVETLRPSPRFAVAANGGVLRQRVLRLVEGTADTNHVSVIGALIGLLCFVGYAMAPSVSISTRAGIPAPENIQLVLVSGQDLAPPAMPELALPEITLASNARARART